MPDCRSNDCVPNDDVRNLDWQTELTAGTVVSYRFPVAEEAGGPEPKARPCLVVDVREIDGQRHAVVAYGTSRQTKTNCGYEVEVRNVEARAAAGLDRRTRFIGARRVTVPLGDAAFVTCRQRDTPILGHLAGGPLARLETLRERFGADLRTAILSPEMPRAPLIARREEDDQDRRPRLRLATSRIRRMARGIAHVGQEIPA